MIDIVPHFNLIRDLRVTPPSFARGAERRCFSRRRYVSSGRIPRHSLELSLLISVCSSAVGWTR